MDQIIQTGRTVEEAEEQALAALGADRNEVEVEILSRGRQGFLGIGGELAEVRVTRLSPTGVPEDEPVEDLDDEGAEDDQPTIDAPAAAPVIPGTPAEAAIQAVERILETVGADVDVSLRSAHDEFTGGPVIDINGPDSGLLIGRQYAAIAAVYRAEYNPPAI